MWQKVGRFHTPSGLRFLWLTFQEGRHSRTCLKTTGLRFPKKWIAEHLSPMVSTINLTHDAFEKRSPSCCAAF